MLLYHGSDRSFQTLKSRQLVNSPDEDRLEREWRKRNAIYLSPSFVFALFFGAKPSRGMNMINIRNRIVYFERLEEFDPQKPIYIYVVDVSDIPEGKARWTHEYELEVQLDEIRPVRIETHRAGEVFEHLEVIKNRKEFERRRKTS